LCMHFCLPLCCACPIHLTLLDLSILINVNEEYTFCSTPLCIFSCLTIILLQQITCFLARSTETLHHYLYFYPTFLKEGRVVYLHICVCTTFQLLNQLTYFHEIFYVCFAIWGHPILSNFLQSVMITSGCMFLFVRWKQHLT
jgi:hypothetical protein